MSIDGSPDQLGRACVLFLVIWSLALIGLAVVLGGAELRGHLYTDPRPGLVEALGISDLSIQPAGRPPRHPSPDAVDLRHSPRLPGAL